MIKQINHDEGFLKRKAVKATRQDAATVTDLMDTLRANQDRCVGMAANMIGVNKRIIAVQMGILSVPMINPEITKTSDPYTAKEGCLSLVGQRSAKRYGTIEVTFLDQKFQEHTQTFSDFIAQTIQHEIDHCNGIII
ncbi:peptide deformylase [Secundilactobacillus paracollinoides]|uniref:Peptide deformylase n=1 Tax=Secundilactobacillus paracollinoides TaxID=240427 RepID=A0A1B2IV09_9LACO|nr:peptide deformylase [Secundilactobacillus paracollinoides]ANZ60100.1 peptide deformylase [Secundilactobacillus paracollinoides]ANZ62945.1 peptide deformylase [Secundilactobacillus paracollinoides]ANZ65894.1 peptide deformylase [Secundilactobacillus paracollinoides]KRL78653.1 peptide deformylase [Secundilactobacillus paracollinoides DSM 15502 = JCM 11969]